MRVSIGLHSLKKLRFPAWAFIMATASLLLLFLCLPTKTYSATERRYLAETPTLTWESMVNGSVSEEVEDYLADHFPGRNLFVGIQAYWNLLTGRNTAQSIYYCDDGFLIRAPETCSTEQLQKNLTYFDNFAADNGLSATLVMIPTAGDVLEGVLPAHHAPYRYDECLALAQQTCTTMEVLELGSTLAEVGEDGFYKTDHHLTSAGTYAVYSAFLQARGRADEVKSQSDYTISQYEGFHGTTWSSSGYWLTAADTLEVWDAGDSLSVTIIEAGEEDVVQDGPFFYENLDSDDLYTVFLDGNHTLVTIENENADSDDVLLLLRDSYAQCLAPFLASHYKTIVMVDLRYYRAYVSQLVQEYGVTEMAVVYGLDSLLTDTNSAWLW